MQQINADWEDFSVLSPFRSPFLIPSVLFHSMLALLALHAAMLPIAKPEQAPISVQLLEPREGERAGSRRYPAGARGADRRPETGPGARGDRLG